MLQKATQSLIAGEQLSESQIEQVADEMMSGNATPIQIASFLTALHMRGESVDDVTAFAKVLRSRARHFARRPGIVLDTCGTGGDSSGTFNISTTAALIAAGAGVRVAKHGNRSMTSKCGSADVLAELGVNLDCDPEVMERALDEVGICFLFAQKYHDSMKHVAPVRRELGFRTIFNLLGPLANPAGASHQLIGVFRPELVETHARVLSRLGAVHGLVVHGTDGLDEITTTDTTFVAEVKGGDVSTTAISPEEFGIARASAADLLGGDAQENARITREILEGVPGARTDIALLNAGAAIYVAGLADSIGNGVARAREAITSGAAREKLAGLGALTREGTVNR